MQNINNLLTYFETKEITFAKGFDEAIMGFDEESKKVIYSVKKMILMLEENSKKKELNETVRMDSLVVAKWLRSTDIEDIPNKFLNKILSKGRCL